MSHARQSAQQQRSAAGSSSSSSSGQQQQQQQRAAHSSQQQAAQKERIRCRVWNMGGDVRVLETWSCRCLQLSRHSMISLQQQQLCCCTTDARCHKASRPLKMVVRPHTTIMLLPALLCSLSALACISIRRTPASTYAPHPAAHHRHHHPPPPAHNHLLGEPQHGRDQLTPPPENGSAAQTATLFCLRSAAHLSAAPSTCQRPAHTKPCTSTHRPSTHACRLHVYS